ncbi:ATP-dependent Clp protease adaptor ClpS [Prevotella sp. PINT]|jgi:Uncharacterized conserved protein|uniref:ATP-dependent Clp protease adaptor ClpS n=1 Tax=Palleniella intestinalis TaxID=2736291 RepID=UPI001553110E|nr:ATP-dependent Clp protease adaptor ClpS [Palleniella intestinalis]NPD82415.1 ATP-dependent Clp protease adaptor ClpS [Palleniella intestinalis]
MPQYKEQEGTGSKTRVRDEEPDMYDVVMLNDDFTTMDFVVEVLRTVFFHNRPAAERIMLAIHKKGQSVVGTYILDIAESKQHKAMQMAQAEGFPLRVKVQPHKG